MSMDIILAGSVAYDYLMTFPGRFTEHILPDKLESISLSFLVDSMVRQRGGVAPNIAYTMSLLGSKPRIFATVGEDFTDYEAWLQAQGLDTSLLRSVPDVQTASFFVNTDRDNNQIASFYPGAMGFAGELSIYDFGDQHPDLIVISPTDPGAMNKYVDECQQLFIPYLYDPSQQIVRLDKDELRRGIEGCRYLFANEYEAALIEDKTGMTAEDIREIAEMVVVTLGADGTLIYRGDKTYKIPAVNPDKILDPTGVGDAFRGGFLVGLSRGWSPELSGFVGALSATYCLEKKGPQAHYYSATDFVERFRVHFDDAGVLNELLDLN